MRHIEQLQHLKNVEKVRSNPITFWRIWEHRFRTRKQLHTLLLHDPDRLHGDLGLSAEDVLEEIRKPFWK